MQSTITSKFQTTIPKKIRESLRLSVSDSLEWTVEDGKIIVLPIRNDFLKYENSVRVGKGDIEKDIRKARKMRTENYR